LGDGGEGNGENNKESKFSHGRNLMEQDK